MEMCDMNIVPLNKFDHVWYKCLNIPNFKYKFFLSFVRKNIVMGVEDINKQLFCYRGY